MRRNPRNHQPTLFEVSMFGKKNERLHYYQLASGLDGYATVKELAVMKAISYSRPATQREHQEYLEMLTLNPFLMSA